MRNSKLNEIWARMTLWRIIPSDMSAVWIAAMTVCALIATSLYGVAFTITQSNNIVAIVLGVGGTVFAFLALGAFRKASKLGGEIDVTLIYPKPEVDIKLSLYRQIYRRIKDRIRRCR